MLVSRVIAYRGSAPLHCTPIMMTNWLVIMEAAVPPCRSLLGSAVRVRPIGLTSATLARRRPESAWGGLRDCAALLGFRLSPIAPRSEEEHGRHREKELYWHGGEKEEQSFTAAAPFVDNQNCANFPEVYSPPRPIV